MAGEPGCGPFSRTRMAEQRNQRTQTPRPAPVLRPLALMTTMSWAIGSPLLPPQLSVEFPLCSKGADFPWGQRFSFSNSGFQGLRGIALRGRVLMVSPPWSLPWLQGSNGVPLELLLDCHVLKTKDCKPAAWVPNPACGWVLFGLTVPSQHFKIWFSPESTDF